VLCVESTSGGGDTEQLGAGEVATLLQRAESTKLKYSKESDHNARITYPIVKRQDYD
jgi:hypothetical protein